MTDVPLSPEYIASIRAEVDALLAPSGLKTDDYWCVTTSTRSTGWRTVGLYLNVPRAGNTMSGIEAVVDAECAMNRRVDKFWLELTCGLTYDDD